MRSSHRPPRREVAPGTVLGDWRVLGPASPDPIAFAHRGCVELSAAIVEGVDVLPPWLREREEEPEVSRAPREHHHDVGGEGGE